MDKEFKFKPSENIKQRLEALYFEFNGDKTNTAYTLLMLDTKLDMVIKYLDDIYDKN